MADLSANPALHDSEPLVPFIFRNRDEIRNRFGMELERVLELYQSTEGRRQLLATLLDASPQLRNADGDAALEQLRRNGDQLHKKETFLKKMLLLPVRTVAAVGRTIRRHPLLLATVGIAAVLMIIGQYMPGGFAAVRGLGGRCIAAVKAFLAQLKGATRNGADMAIDSAGESAPSAAAPADAMRIRIDDHHFFLRDPAGGATYRPVTLEEIADVLAADRFRGPIRVERLPTSRASAEQLLQDAFRRGSVPPENVDWVGGPRP